MTTAAIVWGEQALDELAALRAVGAARPLRRQGFCVNGWPWSRRVNSTALWYATRASGLMALILLTLTMVLGITTTTRARARNWPGFAQQEMHRRISMIAVVFLGIHVLTSVLDTYVNISWAAIVDPVHLELRAVLGRRGRHLARPDDRRLRDQPAAGPDAPGTWRAVHWLAYLSWPVALAHTFGMGTDAARELGHRARRRVRRRGRRRAGLAAPVVSRQASARTAQAAVAGVPPKHLAADGARGQSGGPPCLTSSEALPTTGRYRLLGHPTDLAGHVATLGPVPLPSPRDRGLARGLRLRARGSGLAGRGGAGFPAAIKLAVAHAAGRGGTVLVNAMEGEPASDKDKLLLIRSPHLVLDGAQLLAARQRRAPRHGLRARGARPGRRGRGAGAWPSARRPAARRCPRSWCGRPTASSPARSRRWRAGSSPGESLPSFRPDKGTALRIGRHGALGAQRGDAGARGHDRPHRARRLPGPRPGRGPGDVARHDLRRRGASRRGGDRPGDTADRRRQPGLADRPAPGPPRRRVRRRLGRPARTSRRPTPRSRSVPSGPPPASASWSCSAGTPAGSWSRRASPTTWRARARASAARASTGCPPSPTT